MNWARALHEIAEHGANDRAVSAALARDTVYMPSEVAKRLLSDDVFCAHAPHFSYEPRFANEAQRSHERVVWDSTALGGDRRSPVR